MRKKSVSSALASISKQAKQHLQLTPKSKPRGKRGGARRRRRRSRDDSASSSTSSFDDASSVSSELSDSDFSSSCSEESQWERRSRHRQDRGRRHPRSKDDKRRHERGRRRERGRGERRRHSPDSYGEYTPTRHLQHPLENDASQMIDLLMRILPFYGKGDGNSDAIVIDTIHRLPPHALEMQDVDGNSLLLLASQNGAFDLLPQLLTKGCNVNTRNNVGASCLHFACFVDTFSPDAAMMLVRHGALAEVAEHEFGCTPLHWAAFAGHVELCATLCRAGASARTRDKNGCDPMHYSKQNGHAACTQLLASFSAGGAPGGAAAAEKDGWVRCLDGSTGSSFYHNKDTGESLWGEDFRQVDSAGGASVLDVTSPKKVESREADSDSVKEEAAESSPASSTASTDPLGGAPREKAALADGEIGATSGTRSPADEAKAIGGTSLAAIEEDLDETSSQENDEPTLETCEQDTSSPPGAVNTMDNAEKKPAIDLPASHIKIEPNLDASQHSSELPRDEEPQLAGIADHIVETSSIEDGEPTETNNPDDGSVGVNERDGNAHELTSGASPCIKKEKSVVESASGAPRSTISPDSSVPTENLARNQSFEMRISTLHQRMESQFMTRMQHLEDKIAQQNLETSRKVDDDASKLKENVAEMASTILELRTDAGTKDLEILSLKQQIVKAETDKISNMKQFMNACVGDGDVNDDSKEELVAAIKHHEQELANVKEQLDQALKELNIANEKSQTGEVDSLSQPEVDKGTGNHNQDIESLNSKLLAEQSRATHLEAELTETKAMHKATLAELNEQSKTGSEQLKEELDCMTSELGSVREQLKEAKIERMELILAKDEAETKVQEMTEVVKETETLKKSNEQLHLSLQEETEKRKVLHNTLEDMKGRIRVYVRVRPLSKTEEKANYVNVITKEDERTCVMAGDTATASDVRDWEFDKIFYGSSADGNTQENVFNDTSLLLTSAIDGFNVCIFAYGQTGSGKTYTMLGSGDGCDQGLAPRVAHELFRKLTERESSYDIEVSVSMLELYTDKLCDLLASNKNEKECLDLKIRLAEHTSSGLVEVDGANIEQVANAEELLKVIDRGTKGRASSSTKMNDESSRSHMIATIVLSLRNRRTGKLVHGKVTLVDLAGSERVSKSGATGQQLKEAQSINKSLSALGDVIGALTSGGRQHIPYRNHPLTMLMSDSIGGNAKTLMFVCCSPADYNRKETANSLDFAKRCRNVTNNAVTSKCAAGSTASSNVSQIRALRKELSKIKEREKGGSTVKRRPIRRPGM